MTVGDRTVDGTFIGADTVTAASPTAVVRVRGQRTYQLGELGTCTGEVKAEKFGPFNAAIDMTEKLKCDTGARVMLTVNDLTPILVNGQPLGWNRSIEGRVKR